MLKHQLIHPEINAILGMAGHSSQVLIADGNYPSSSTLGPNATLVSLNLSPGLLTVNQVFKVLLTAIPVEAVATMGMPDDDQYKMESDPPVWNTYRQTISDAKLDIPLGQITRWQFYEEVASPANVLTIQTGDQALWANLLLTIGVRKESD